MDHQIAVSLYCFNLCGYFRRQFPEVGLSGKFFAAAGPEALTHSDMAEKLSTALKRQIECIDVPPEAMNEALISFGIPRWQTEGPIEDYAHYRRGEASAVAWDINDVTDSTQRSFDGFARDYAPAFS